MEARPRGRAGADVSGADAPRARTLARAVAAGPGRDDCRRGGRLGARSAHHRRVARPVLPGRASQHHLRAERWFPPALTGARQAALKAAVQASPRAAGIEAGDWNWKVV